MKKARLLQKICIVCGRPFAWRRGWAACWAEVRYCGERGRRHRSNGRRAARAADDAG